MAKEDDYSSSDPKPKPLYFVPRGSTSSQSLEGFLRLTTWEQQNIICEAQALLAKIEFSQPYPTSKYIDEIDTSDITSFESLHKLIGPIEKIHGHILMTDLEWEQLQAHKDMCSCPEIPEYYTIGSPFELFNSWAGGLCKRTDIDQLYPGNYSGYFARIERWINMTKVQKLVCTQVPCSHYESTLTCQTLLP